MKAHLLIPLIGCMVVGAAAAEEGANPDPKRIHVIVALCDNEHQGIAPVNARIGNGDDLENNLYWGCSDGLWRWFQASDGWELLESKKAEPNPSASDPWVGVKILETQIWEHRRTGAILVAEAWRGREIEAATHRFVDLLSAKGEESPDLVALIGHNGLMDFRFFYHPDRKAPKKRDAIVLCCKSRAYFSEILTDLEVRPVLLTEQFMYPGSFLLDAALEGWLNGEDRSAIRDRAARAYVRNQKISLKAARGVFSNLD